MDIKAVFLENKFDTLFLSTTLLGAQPAPPPLLCIVVGLSVADYEVSPKFRIELFIRSILRIQTFLVCPKFREKRTQVFILTLKKS